MSKIAETIKNLEKEIEEKQKDLISLRIKQIEDNEGPREKAVTKISNLAEQARELIFQAEQLADEHNIDFAFSVSWGMGGSYRPKGQTEYGRGHWVSSSQEC